MLVCQAIITSDAELMYMAKGLFRKTFKKPMTDEWQFIQQVITIDLLKSDYLNDSVKSVRSLLSKALEYALEEGNQAEVKQILEYSKRNLLTLQIDQEQLDQLIRRESYALIDQLTISRNV